MAERINNTYSFKITLDPKMMGQLRSKVSIALDLTENGAKIDKATLSQFAITGGNLAITTIVNSHGDFASGISMGDTLKPAQVIATIDQTVSSISFKAVISCTSDKKNMFTVRLVDVGGTGFPTSAATDYPGLPGLFAILSWNSGKDFSSKGFVGNGTIQGLPDNKFSATVQP